MKNYIHSFTYESNTNHIQINILCFVNWFQFVFQYVLNWTGLHCTIPVDTPLRLYLGDGGILYILKPQVFLEMSFVYAHRHRHVAIAMQGSVGTTGEPLATPPKVIR